MLRFTPLSMKLLCWWEALAGYCTEISNTQKRRCERMDVGSSGMHATGKNRYGWRTSWVGHLLAMPYQKFKASW
nr:hypothetical protein [Entomoplasma sp. MP1]